MKDKIRKTGPVTDTKDVRSSKMFLITLVTLLAILIMANTVLALPFGDKISGFFDNYASNDEPGLFDLFLFTVIFFALCWIGFSSVFKDAKNANIMLSLSVGVSLSIALVYGGKFGLVKLLPFAGIVLFIVAFVLIFALLKKFIFTKDTILSKILSTVVAIIIAIALIMFVWNTICDSGKCESNAFMQKFTGTDSILGKFMYWLDNLSTGAPIPSPPSTSPGAVTKKTQLCGNGKLDSGETCDPRASPNGCQGGLFKLDQVCDNCERCQDQSSAGAVYDNVAGNKLIYVAVAIIFGLLFWQRKDLKEKYRKRKERKKNKKGLEALEETLKKIEEDEKSMLHSFGKLCKAVRNEKTTFEHSRHIVDEITADIKETIGGEIEFIKAADADQGGNISTRVDQLVAFNNTEKHLITGDEGILNKIDEQLKKIEEVPKELQDEINALENTLEHFDDHNRILQTFKQHDFIEKNILVSMTVKLRENKDNFSKMSGSCNVMIEILKKMHDEIRGIVATGKIDYPMIRKHIREIRDNAIRLNRAFSDKVSVLHQIMHRLQEIKEDIARVHEEEKSRILLFLEDARKSHEHGRLDSAIYLASHVIEIVDNLKNSELDAGSREALLKQADEAKKIIEESLPRLFDSMNEEIQKELDKGEFDKVLQLTEHIGKVEFIRDEFNTEFRHVLSEYEKKVDQLRKLCEKMKENSDARKGLFEDLGLAPQPPAP